MYYYLHFCSVFTVQCPSIRRVHALMKKKYGLVRLQNHINQQCHCPWAAI